MGLSLFLIRHEDAEQPTENLPDLHRGLSPAGRARMRSTSSFFAEKERLDLLLTSPYVRAVQTSEILAAVLSYTGPVHSRGVLAEPPSVQALLFAIEELRRDAERIALVSHEPTLTDLASHLLGDRFPRMFDKGMILALDYDPAETSASFRYLIEGRGPTLSTCL